MKNNKRVLSLLAAGALILTAACSNTPAAESPTPSASVQPSESQPQVTAPVTAAANGYVYMSPVRAFIFTKKQCGDDFGSLVGFIQEKVKQYKDYEPEETEENGGTDE